MKIWLPILNEVVSQSPAERVRVWCSPAIYCQDAKPLVFRVNADFHIQYLPQRYHNREVLFLVREFESRSRKNIQCQYEFSKSFLRKDDFLAFDLKADGGYDSHVWVVTGEGDFHFPNSCDDLTWLDGNLLHLVHVADKALSVSFDCVTSSEICAKNEVSTGFRGSAAQITEAKMLSVQSLKKRLWKADRHFVLFTGDIDRYKDQFMG